MKNKRRFKEKKINLFYKQILCKKGLFLIFFLFIFSIILILNIKKFNTAKSIDENNIKIVPQILTYDQVVKQYQES